MKSYYVKLSCPGTNESSNFKEILQACLNKQIKNFEFTNIPVNINELRVNDSVVFILSGDVSNKNSYFRNDESLKSFDNGIYAIGKVTSITPTDKKFTATIYPLNESVSREQLYLYPQFSDNLGVMTKGSPNQAGLYNLSDDVYLSLLDYLTINKLIDTTYQVLTEVNYSKKLSEVASANPLFSAAKNLESFKSLAVLLNESTLTHKNDTKTSGRDHLIKLFCEWFSKPENFKASYEGLVTYKVLNSWDEDFFNKKIFLISHTNVDEDIKKIKTLIENSESNQEWSKFNESSSKGAPKAVLGKNNYFNFLDSFSKDSEELEKYGQIFQTSQTKKHNTFLRLSKPFVLLAGISGTGKTRYIREQASRTGSIEQTYQLVPVRPDWHEPSDLLGYTSRISGAPIYIATDVLRFIVKAWAMIFDTGINYENNSITGRLNDLLLIPPYWLCLDEMNLAPVEQYFSDFLSILETREWENDGTYFKYNSDSILSGSVINQGGDQLRNDLNISDERYNLLWEQFIKQGIPIPPNLIVAGTVNMDETTHVFSRKVLDRALSFDFGDFFPNIFESYFTPTTEPITLSYPIWSHSMNETTSISNTFDKDGKRSIAFLSAINKTLEGSYFKVAYRTLNELLLSVIAFNPQTEKELQAVWDDFVMCKILPRIEGDFDKLAINHSSGDHQETILSALNTLLEDKLSLIWEGDTRPDLYRQHINSEMSDPNPILISCRSKNKISWMEGRLKNTSFTSYWA